MTHLDEVERIAAAITVEELRAVVKRASGASEVCITDWRRSRLGAINGWGELRGLFRFEGDASIAGVTSAWSFVLKVVRRRAGAADDPARASFWRREAYAYGSPLLSAIPGLVPARCYGVETRDAETFTLWLEDLKDEYPSGWPLERYGLAAAHLGEMNGAYLMGDRSADPAWLLRRDVGVGLTGAAAKAAESLIRAPETWAHPEVRRAFPEPAARLVLEQWQHRHTFRAVVRELPVTLCHNDAHAHNLFSRRRGDGGQETVALDWELVGIAPIATDVTYLVIATLRRFALDMAHADDLERIVIDGYVAGLERSGWRGDRAEVERAYLAAVALRAGLVPQTIGLIMSAAQRAHQQSAWGRPAQELIERWTRVAHFVLERVRRARDLLAGC